jgi:ribose transport system permease protein
MNASVAREESIATAPAPNPIEARPAVHRRYDFGAVAPILFFASLIFIFGIADPSVFLSRGNLTSILNDGAVLAILACGLTVVLVVGEFDLSIASAASLGGALPAVLIAHANWPLVPVVLLVIASGVTIGLVNGVLVTTFEMPALIATIGIASLLDGITLWITGYSIIFTGFTDSFIALGSWSLGGLQAPVFYLAAIAIILGIALRYTATGRYLYATGGNRSASRMSGIRVRRQIILAFVVSDVLGALAGLIYTGIADAAIRDRIPAPDLRGGVPGLDNADTANLPYSRDRHWCLPH